jgi:phosphinothricin acetyltransferase
LIEIHISAMTEADWPAVAAIYQEGIDTGHATFAARPPESWEKWSAIKINSCSLVARAEDQVLGWAALSPVSTRAVYAGVAEESIYVRASARGEGVGTQLLQSLIDRAEAEGIWTLETGIFAENEASLRLHYRCGFRLVGVREKKGKMGFGPYRGRWRDVLLLERRSRTVGV